MPEGLPQQFWDDKSGQVKMADFVTAHNDLVKASSEHKAKLDALPKKAEDYKLELKLPSEVKMPDGLDIKIDEKDQRVVGLRAFALKHGMTNDAVNELIALDAQSQIAAFNASEELLQAEMQKLGANGKERVSAMNAFLEKHVPAAQREALRPFVANAEAFAGLETLISKITSSTNVPGNQQPRQGKPAEVPVEQRWYGPQQKAS